jgi:hypothetical protein
VVELVASERRASAPTTVTSRLGWGHVLRAARNDGDHVRLTRVDGASIEAVVDVVGRDFVAVTLSTGRVRRVPFAAIAALTFSAS